MGCVVLAARLVLPAPGPLLDWVSCSLQGSRETARWEWQGPCLLPSLKQEPWPALLILALPYSRAVG